MKYNFDTIINRTGTNSAKWDSIKKNCNYPEVIPMWAADMDFISPKAVIDALRNRIEHGVFGYTATSDTYKDAVLEWIKEYHNWELKTDWIRTSHGVIPAISWLIESLTEPGDKVIVQKPVYSAFFSVPEVLERIVVNNSLKIENGRYIIDYEDFEEKARDPKAKVFILCNPHNPVGRVWERHELQKLGEICKKNGVIVISDEIHADLVFKKHKHIPFASVSEELAKSSIVCMAPSKTFNLAGLQTSNIIIPDSNLRSIFDKALKRIHIETPNLLSLTACEAAYRCGGDWLSQVIDYIEENSRYLSDYICRNIPKLKVTGSEGTFLAWIDCRGLNMDCKDLEKFMLEKAGVYLSQGYLYGDEGRGFVRMNVGCARPILEDALIRISNAINNLEA